MKQSTAVIILILVVLLVVGGIFISIRGFGSLAKQESEDKQALTEMQTLWETGAATTGLAVKQEGANLMNYVDVTYTVDGVEYKSTFSVAQAEFQKIDGDDKDGQGEVEVHYDAEQPENAVIEAALAQQAKRTEAWKGLTMLLVMAILYVIIMSVYKRKK